MKNSIKKFNIGILSAMPEEIGNILENVEELNLSKYGSLKIYSGLWKETNNKSIEIKIFTAWSGWGKVNSAYAATRIINEAEKTNHKLDLLIFTGVAGAIDKSLNQWDVLIANSFIQHDMDARPMFEKFVIPTLNLDQIKTNLKLEKWAIDSLKNQSKDGLLRSFGKIKSGLIGTGDKFIGDTNEVRFLLKDLPELKAVEMEGGAVAQVLLLESIPYLAIRVISDKADENAPEAFLEFLKKYEVESCNLIKSLLMNILNKPK